MGTGESPQVSVRVEIKSVNGRFLKVSLRSPPAMHGRESDVETVVKEQLLRGSISVTVVMRHKDPAMALVINEELALAYQQAFRRLGLAEERIPMLPGVLGGEATALTPDDWQTVESALRTATNDLVADREREGTGLVAVVDGLLVRIHEGCETMGARAPEVLLEYRDKLRSRLEKLLAGEELPVEPEHVAREVAVMADRCDITEELDRLGLHVARAREMLTHGGEVGRKMEFLAQEMHREVNTIGSKSSDAALAHAVVDLKTDIERVKEQVANLE